MARRMVRCTLQDICDYGSSQSPPISCWVEYSWRSNRHCRPHLRKEDCSSRNSLDGCCHIMDNFLGWHTDALAEALGNTILGRCKPIKENK